MEKRKKITLAGGNGRGRIKQKRSNGYIVQERGMREIKFGKGEGEGLKREIERWGPSCEGQLPPTKICS